MNDAVASSVLTRKAKDYATDQEVRWCPGCGDYAILKAVQKVLADRQADPDQTVCISGIGCAARFPYYLNTYGFHTIHGRAAAIATGVHLANPDLDIWLVSGDGDSLSIGTNHLVHLLRRDIDLQYLLFNNEIYGLTKGQTSPTSRVGTVSPSNPTGSVDTPVDAVRLALGAGARFVARGLDVNQQRLVPLLKRAHAHRGTSFVEILQNCIVYNDGVFDELSNKATAAARQLWVEHGQPMLYGAENNQGLRLQTASLKLEPIDLTDPEVSLTDVLVHDETNLLIATLLAQLSGSDLPTPMGVLYCQPGDSYSQRHPPSKKDLQDLDRLLAGGHTWEISG